MVLEHKEKRVCVCVFVWVCARNGRHPAAFRQFMGNADECFPLGSEALCRVTTAQVRLENELFPRKGCVRHRGHARAGAGAHEHRIGLPGAKSQSLPGAVMRHRGNFAS